MTCHHCGKEKIAWAFSIFKTRKGEIRRRGICRQCRGKRQEQRREYYTEWRRLYNKRNKTRRQRQYAARRAEVKKYVDALKSTTPCTDCRKKFPAVCMDFDHVRGRKSRSVSTLVSGAYRLEIIKAEIELCDIVCANCHRVRTYSTKANHAPVKTIAPVADVSGLSRKHLVHLRSEFAAGEPVRLLAKRFSLSEATVKRLVYLANDGTRFDRKAKSATDFDRKKKTRRKSNA